MEDDLFIDRLRRKERFRQIEEERRQRMLASSKPVHSGSEHAAAAVDASKCAIPTKSEKIDAYPSSVLKNYAFCKPNNAVPVDVGYMNMKSSPLSSVSMSQTPEKMRSKQNEQKIAVRFDSERSLSSCDDLVLKKPSFQTEAAGPTVSFRQTVAVASGKRKLAFDDDDDTESDGEDLLLLARKKENPLYEHPVPPTEAVIATAETTSEPVLKSPRNPLTLMKQENDIEMVRKMSPISHRLSAESNRQLWSDSEEEKFLPSSKLATRRKSQPKAKSLPNVESADGILGSLTSSKNFDDIGSKDKPSFASPKFGPYVSSEPFLLRPHKDDETYEVPASICRYLPEYQREGIQFLYRCGICTKRGAILGDDMGLGKTVQTISLLAALFRKTGTEADLAELNRRKRLVETKTAQVQREQEQSLLAGRGYQSHSNVKDILPDLALPKWCPVLIAAPNSVVTNWVEDFKTWAHFNVAVYQGSGNGRDAALASIENGVAEILVCGQSMIQNVKGFSALNSANVRWKIVIIDEFHTFKNETKHLATNLRNMRDRHGCVVLGLTGTLMQNNHKELWNLVDIVAKDFLGPWNQFNDDFALPIQLSRTKDATIEAVELGDDRAMELSAKLQQVYLRRSKEDTLSKFLPKKDERIVFCELSALQKELYEYILEQPDFVVLRQKNAPCDCGVNRQFFAEYLQLRTKEEQIEYQRRNRDNLHKRGGCCYRYPRVNGGVDPTAVLWRQQHPNGEVCEQCPSCIAFAAMSILYKLCTHVALLQVKGSPSLFEKGSAQHTEAVKNHDRAVRFLPKHLLTKIPGGYFLSHGIMNDHFKLSGKMAVLDKLLRAISTQQGRVLLFAHSTKSLDLIENYVMSMGYSYLRMDGQTPNAKRKVIADKFRASPDIFLLILSTKAMGLGLNLTVANNVIMFDVDWNPASDSQAQDRAYRIGQEKDVKVFRLVSRGTIEELKYLRQVYKTQLKSETIIDVKNVDRQKASRLFRGVAGDEHRKGELFGLENLLKYKDGTFMNYSSKVVESNRYGIGVHDTSDLLDTVKDLSEEDLDNIGGVENLFESTLKSVNMNDTSDGPDRDDDDTDIGGMSQVVMDVCEQLDVLESDTPQKSPGAMIALKALATIDETFSPEAMHENENETQSPLYDALNLEPRGLVAQEVAWNANLSTSFPVVPSALVEPPSSAVTQAPFLRNTKIVGKTSDQIRRGEAGPTTFSRSDLYLPGRGAL